MPRATVIAVATIIGVAGVAGVAGGTAIGLSVSGFSAIPGVFGGSRVSTIGAVDFTNPLSIPPLAASTIDESGRRTFTLTAQTGSTEFIDGSRTPTWGFNGSYLGPTLVAERGERVQINVRNELDEPTTVHWHGMHLPSAMDGGPHQKVESGAEWSPSWTIDQPASTLWYHPHPHGATEDHVARGLAGLFYVTDPLERGLDLPHEYGVDDIPVIVQDVRFDAAGALDRRGGFVGALGDRILVNGTLAPILEVDRSVVRLRLLNASTARVFNFGFDDGRDIVLIGTDGGLLPRPQPLESLPLSPGERAEILVAVTPGETVVLQSRDPQLGAVVPFGGPDGGSDAFDVLQVNAAESLASEGVIPSDLVPIESLREADASAERSFVLDGTEINGRTMDLNRVNDIVILNSTEIWTVTNDMPRPHNFHVHGVQFQVLDQNGAAPPPTLSGWKDTIYLEPNVSYRLIMQFENFSDPNMPYMYHCHLLAHEDAGMMGQFVVVKPGESVGTPGGTVHQH
ncbi:FtsP/CotA-like multicopper oxidase with cupredoxin domain [Salinibacterium sp. CAN_S4]|uniref:multicopper oxidase family protein n=1 Tax=Salinibacterium sp. CAN_S4 TaxID=2787727 RepID=UPI0018EFDB44